VAAWATSFGSGVTPEFFATIASVGPVFGLALFVEIAVVMGRVVSEQGPTRANRALARVLIRTNLGLTAISEGVSLYATGSDRQSTLLVVGAILPLVIQLVLLAETAYLRLGISRVPRG
jgi:hypothetical protein